MLESLKSFTLFAHQEKKNQFHDILLINNENLHYQDPEKTLEPHLDLIIISEIYLSNCAQNRLSLTIWSNYQTKSPKNLRTNTIRDYQQKYHTKEISKQNSEVSEIVQWKFLKFYHTKRPLKRKILETTQWKVLKFYRRKKRKIQIWDRTMENSAVLSHKERLF